MTTLDFYFYKYFIFYKKSLILLIIEKALISFTNLLRTYNSPVNNMSSMQKNRTYIIHPHISPSIILPNFIKIDLVAQPWNLQY